MLMEMLLQCMKLGMKEKDYWDMTLAEVMRETDALIWRKNDEYKNAAFFTYQQAVLVLSGLNGKFPGIEEAFPGIYSTEELESAKAKLQAEEFLAYANARIEREQNNG